MPDGTAERRNAFRMRWLLIGVGVLVSATLMYVAVRGAHPSRTIDALRETNVALLVPSVAVMAVAFLVRAIRWQSLFTPSTRPGLSAVVGAQFVGYVANAVLPVRAGEAAAIVALNKRARTPVAEATATMLVQRAEDVLSLVLLLFVMLPWLPHVSWLRAAGAIAVSLLLVLAIVALVVVRLGERAVALLVRPLRRLRFVPQESLDRAPANFVRGLAGLVTARIALVSFAWTTLSWIILGVAYWLVMKACSVPLSPLAGILVVVGIGLAMILPSSPAAVGVFEGATVVVLSAYAVDDSKALSYALVLHLLNVLPLFAAAAVVAVVRRARGRGVVPTLADSA